MTREKAIEILKKHNEWRRDNSIPPKTEMPNPKEIGEAIDFAIEFMKISDYCNCDEEYRVDVNRICVDCGKFINKKPKYYEQK